MKTRLLTRLGLLLLLAVTVSTATDTAVKRSQARGKEIVQACAEAMGGADAIKSLETIHLKGTLENTPRYQMPTVDPPHKPSHTQEDLVYDLKGSRFFAEQVNHGFGFDGWNKIAIKNGEGQNFDFRARTVTHLDSAAVNTPQYGQFYRRLPILIVRDALSRPLTLRYLGDDNFNGRKQHVVTYVHTDGGAIALYIDASTKLVTKYELLYPDGMTGDEAAELIYDPYVESGKFKVPTGMTQRLAGDVSAQWKYKVTFNEPVADSTFQLASDGFTEIPNVVTPPPMSVEKLGKGVYLVQNIGGAFYNMLAVEFKDYVVTMEAPNTTGQTESAIKKIREQIPDKPIRYASFTHHHNDHMGGIRALIEEDATIVTTPGNRKLVAEYAAAKQKDSLAKNPKPAKIEVIENGKRVFTDGEQTIELYDIGPTSHAKEMLVAYLPNEKLIYQGDLFFAPFDDKIPVGPAQLLTTEFGAWLQKSGLQVQRIAAVHGKTVNYDVLDAALKTPPGSVPAEVRAGGQ